MKRLLMSMVKFGIMLLLVVALVPHMWVGTANATLIGDTVTVGHYFPDNITPLSGATPPATFAVEAGNTDLYAFYNSYPFGYTVNVEAASIFVDFSYIILPGETAIWPDTTQSCGFSEGGFGCTTVPASFNGLGVSGLNDSSGNVLQSVVVDTNMVGWNLSRLSFGHSLGGDFLVSAGDFLRFDWKGLSFNNTTYLNATLDFGQSSSVPEPSTFLLLGSGLAGLGFWRMRKGKV